jgi:hypothetical protein
MLMKTISFRLKPGDDLKSEIENVIKKNGIKAGFIITCVGGLQKATVRMAGATPENQDIRTITEDLEIVSLVGTVSINGVHLHISYSNKDGMVRGGHLKENTIVYPTAELVIGVDEAVEFSRHMDKETGFKELFIE